MKYAKPWLSLDDQADLLIKRGLDGERDLFKARLSSVNYYRLSGYLYPFRIAGDAYKQGTTFEEVWRRYVFDRRLRLMVMDAIERIEVAVRSQLAYHHANHHGPFGYADDPSSLPKLRPEKYQEFLTRVSDETDRSHELFVNHFRDKYGDVHPFLPVWMMTEVMSFGTVLTFFKGSSHQVKRGVASFFGMPDTVFESWLLALTTVRNICAHHARLWNRVLGVKPMTPRPAGFPDWHRPIHIQNERVFAILTICRYCLTRVAPAKQVAAKACCPAGGFFGDSHIRYGLSRQLANAPPLERGNKWRVSSRRASWRPCPMLSKRACPALRRLKRNWGMRSRASHPISDITALRSQIAISSRDMATPFSRCFAGKANLKELRYGW